MTKNNVTYGRPSFDSGEAQTLTLEVYERLRADIRSGNLNPGLPLRLEWLKETYDVGATPLREALSRLAAEYLVTSEGKKGFRVASVSYQEYKELVSIRNNIESQALEIAIRQGDDNWEADVVGAFHRLSKAPSGAEAIDMKSVEEREKRHRAFHVSLIAACDSTWLLRIWWQITSHMERHRRVAFGDTSTTPENAVRIEEEHRRIMEAVLDRDAQEACKLLNGHRQAMEAKVLEWAAAI